MLDDFVVAPYIQRDAGPEARGHEQDENLKQFSGGVLVNAFDRPNEPARLVGIAVSA
jgi:hypothetical protein